MRSPCASDLVFTSVVVYDEEASLMRELNLTPYDVELIKNGLRIAYAHYCARETREAVESLRAIARLNPFYRRALHKVSQCLRAMAHHPAVSRLFGLSFLHHAAAAQPG